MPKIGEKRYIEQKGKTKRHLSVWSACPDCSRERWVRLINNMPISLYCRHCWQVGSRHPSWRGGRRITTGGYVEIKLHISNLFYPMANCMGYVLEHRLVMAQHLGRQLLPKEVVHHKNGVRTDNDIGNLELSRQQGEHIRNHAKGYRDGYKKGYAEGLALASKYYEG